MRLSFIAVLCALGLSACGTSLSDRTLSGGTLGAVGSALIGGDPLVGAAVGIGVGALTNASQIDLGEPMW